MRCGACGLPESACVCGALPTLETKVRVAIVMHHIEAVRSSNTGRLVARMLGRTVTRLRGLRDAAVEPTPEGRRLVLFPAEGARVLRREDASDDLVLVVPDGTWSQARRIHRRDPWTEGAEAVTLPESRESEYELRHGAHDGGLCTIEAVAAAMGVLEGAAVEAAMREGFTLWRERALALRTSRGG